jgi:hypothetical protein
MKIAQRIVFVLSLIVGISYFVYALAFASNWALGEGLLGDFYLDMQAANHMIFQWALTSVVFAALSMIVQSGIKRRYTVFNYAFAIATIYAMIQAAMITTPLCQNLEAAYRQLNPIIVELLFAINFTKNPDLVFQAGYLFSTLLYAQAALMTVFLVVRFAHRLIAAKAKQHFFAENAHANPNR